MEEELMWESGRGRPELNSSDTKTRFKDYIVLVAGGCRGIGRAAAERFLNDGATVYILDISIYDEESLKSKYGDSVICAVLDITDQDRCKQVVAEIAAKHSNTINVLVNTAAYFGSKGLTAKRDDWIKSFDVNVIGYANMVQAAEHFMKDDGRSSIVNLTSISAVRCHQNRWTYAATKGAIAAMTRNMAFDLRVKRIRVNAVIPSWIWTRETAKAANFDRVKGEAMWGGYQMFKKFGEVEEIAAAITFLASKDAHFITGTHMDVTGGLMTMGPEGQGETIKFVGENY